MNMLSPLIWVWPRRLNKKSVVPWKARAELSGLSFTPSLQAFYFEARVSLRLPPCPLLHPPPNPATPTFTPQTRLTRLNSMRAAKIIHLCLKTVKSGSNKGGLAY